MKMSNTTEIHVNRIVLMRANDLIRNGHRCVKPIYNLTSRLLVEPTSQDGFILLLEDMIREFNILTLERNRITLEAMITQELQRRYNFVKNR